MALTPQQIQQMNQITGLNKPATASQASTQSRIQQLQAIAKQSAPQTNIIQKTGASIAETAKSGLENIKSGISDIYTPPDISLSKEPVNPKAIGSGTGSKILEAGAKALQGGEHAVAGLGKVVGGVAQVGLSPILGPTTALGGAIGEKVGSEVPSDAAMKFEDMLRAHPEIGKNATDIMNMANLAFPEAMKGVAPAIESGISKVKNAAADLAESVATTPESSTAAKAASAVLQQKEANQFIAEKYTHAIKPTIVGKTNPGQLEKYNANVGKAIATIVENKPNLTLTDQFGEATGKLPQTIDEFRQAIDQSKAAIFKQYDAMAKAAGESGATVDLAPAASELQKVANNKVIQDLHPDLAAYANSRADSLLKRGTYTTEEAQTATQNLNKSLEAYYRNPSYETASRASVDALIANQLRTGLDASIEKAGQEGYGDLKGKYAALKAIEKDVTKRGVVEARQTGGRGLNVGDIVSAEELIRGLATMNPSALATAGAIKGIQALRKWYTDPNRAIKQMFEKAEATTRLPSSPETTSPTGKTVPSQ